MNRNRNHGVRFINENNTIPKEVGSRSSTTANTLGEFMKRIGERYAEICSWENIESAHKEAKRGKTSYKEVKWVEANLHSCLARVKWLLENEEYNVSKYTIINRREGGKMRTIHKLPYFPDRIIHHAVLRVLGGDLRKSYIRDTFQSIPNRGTSDARKRVRKFIQKNSPKFYLQLDLKKYYPSVDHDYLKSVLLRFIKCRKTLKLLFKIIDSCEGLPIGNFTSQDLGNLNLTPFDWFVKQELRVKGYFRYCDDLVFFGDSKEELEEIRYSVTKYLSEIKLKVKEDYTLKLLDEGLDFIGYVFYPSGLKLRESIYIKAKEALRVDNYPAMCAYYGWLLPTKQNKLKVEYVHAISRKKK